MRGESVYSVTGMSDRNGGWMVLVRVTAGPERFGPGRRCLLRPRNAQAWRQVRWNGGWDLRHLQEEQAGVTL